MKKRKLHPSNFDGVALGVTWYREVDWPRIKTLFPDAKELHDTHAEWLKSAEDTVKSLKRRGIDARPVIVDIDDFIAWCLVRGCKLDAKARVDYITGKLQTELKSRSLSLGQI